MQAATTRRPRRTVFGSTIARAQARRCEKPRSTMKRSATSRRSASRFFSRRFSSSSDFSFAASDGAMPPYLAFQR
jgi:hypothetical protein